MIPIDITERFGRRGLKLSHVSITYWSHRTISQTYNPYHNRCRLSPADLAHITPDMIRLRYRIKLRGAEAQHELHRIWRHWDYYVADGIFRVAIKDYVTPASDAEKELAFELLGAVI